MVKTKLNIVVLICFSCYVFLTGCQKSPINGDLDGKWQILEIEEDGVVKDKKDEQFYYNFYLHVCSLSYYGGVFTEGNLHYENDEIYMEFPYINTPDGMAILRTNYGIYFNPVIFKIIFLDKKKLIISNDKSIITLRKF